MANILQCSAIVLNQQSLTTAAPSSDTQFTHYLSLASTSKSDTQRRDALSYLSTSISSRPVNTPTPSGAIVLPALLPLLLDGTTSVRSNLLKLLALLPTSSIAPRTESALLYIRAGLTHLAADIRNDSLSALEWLLEAVGEEVVSCPGGWVKTLNAFMGMMGWGLGNNNGAAGKWSSAPKATFGKGGKSFPRQVLVLAQFLKVGLRNPDSMGIDGATGNGRGSKFPYWDTESNAIPNRSGAFAYLNLFGAVRDEEGEMYTEREARQRVFARMFQASVEKGMENAKKEGGELGRAAAVLGKVLLDGMGDYDEEF